MKTIVALDLNKILKKDGIWKDWKMLVEKNSIFKAMLGYDSYPKAIDLYLEKFKIEKELTIVFPEIYLKLFGGLLSMQGYFGLITKGG
ncbi:hypothetical protein GQ457_09G010790 [Hibiscus cannabinus]